MATFTKVVNIAIMISICHYVVSFKIPNPKSALNFLNVGKNNDKRSEGPKDVTCGLHKLTNDVSYRIQTPLANYGLFVPSGYQCNWEFFGTENCNPAISCDPFSLPETVNCTGANLEITDGYSVTEKFCGTNGPVNITTGSSIMQVGFNSNLSPPSKGFICLVTCADKNSQLVANQLAQPNIANCKCGVPGSAAVATPSSGRIVGGRAAKLLFWKWQAAITPKTRKSPFCGGSLINDRFLLSAAHCIVTTGLISFPAAADVVLNDYDIKNSSETITIRRSIISVHPHPLYNTITQDYDFALIQFEPLNLTNTEEPKVTPVCLPPQKSKDSYIGITGTATGWGTIAEGGSQPDVLQEADIPIISNEDCAKLYENKITPRMLCAAYPDGKIDSCQGDSGGPFVINNSGVYTEVGVVSFGEGCARAGKPGVYSRVTEANDWIRLVSRTATWCQE